MNFTPYKGSKISNVNGLTRVQSQVAVIQSGCTAEFKAKASTKYSVSFVIDNHNNEVILTITLPGNSRHVYSTTNGENIFSFETTQAGSVMFLIMFIKAGTNQVLDIISLDCMEISTTKPSSTEPKVSSQSSTTKSTTTASNSGTNNKSRGTSQPMFVRGKNGKRHFVGFKTTGYAAVAHPSFIVPLYDKVYLMSSNSVVDQYYQRCAEFYCKKYQITYTLTKAETDDPTDKIATAIRQAITDNSIKALFLDVSCMFASGFSWDDLANLRDDTWDILFVESKETQAPGDNSPIVQCFDISESSAFILKRQMFQLSLDLLSNKCKISEYFSLLQRKQKAFSVVKQRLINSRNATTTKRIGNNNSLTFYPKVELILYINSKATEESIMATIRSIHSQQLKESQSYEITLVNDSGCNISNVVKICESLEFEYPVKILTHEIASGFSSSMNEAIGLSRAEMITWVCPGWILYPSFVDAMLTAHKEQSAEFITSRVLNMTTNTIVDAVYISQTINNYLNYKGIQSFVCSRNLYEKLKGTNENLTMGQDYEFFTRVYGSSAKTYALDFTLMKCSDFLKDTDYLDNVVSSSVIPATASLSDAVISMFKAKEKEKQNQSTESTPVVESQNITLINQQIREYLDISKDSFAIVLNNTDVLSRRMIGIIQSLRSSFNVYIVKVWETTTQQFTESAQRVDKDDTGLMTMNYQTFNDFSNSLMINNRYLLFESPELCKQIQSIKNRLKLKTIFYDFTQCSFDTTPTIATMKPDTAETLDIVDVIFYSSIQLYQILKTTKTSAKLEYLPNAWELLEKDSSDDNQEITKVDPTKVKIVGYYGYVNSLVDFNILKKIADNPAYHLVVIGTLQKPEYNQTFTHSNITWGKLSKDSTDEVDPLELIRKFDICVLPYKSTNKNILPGMFIPDGLMNYAKMNKPIISTIDYSHDIPELKESSGLFVVSSLENIIEDLDNISNRLNCEIEISYPTITKRYSPENTSKIIISSIQANSIFDLEEIINKRKRKLTVFADLVIFYKNGDHQFANTDKYQHLYELLQKLDPYFSVQIIQYANIDQDITTTWNNYNLLIKKEPTDRLDRADPSEVLMNEFTIYVEEEYYRVDPNASIKNIITVDFYVPDAIACLFTSRFADEVLSQELPRCYCFSDVFSVEKSNSTIPQLPQMDILFLGPVSNDYGADLIQPIKKMLANEQIEAKFKWLGVQFPDQQTQWGKDEVEVITPNFTKPSQEIQSANVVIAVSRTHDLTTMSVNEAIKQNKHLITTYDIADMYPLGHKVQYHARAIVNELMGRSQMSFFEDLGWINDKSRNHIRDIQPVETTKTEVIESEHFWKNYIAKYDLNVHDAQSMKKIISFDQSFTKLDIFNPTIPVALVITPEDYVNNLELLRCLVVWHNVDIIVYSDRLFTYDTSVHFTPVQSLDGLKQIVYPNYKVVVCFNGIPLKDFPMPVIQMCSAATANIADISIINKFPIIVRNVADHNFLRKCINSTEDMLNCPIYQVPYFINKSTEVIDSGESQEHSIGCFMTNSTSTEEIFKTVKRIIDTTEFRDIIVNVYYVQDNPKGKFTLEGMAKTLGITCKFTLWTKDTIPSEQIFVIPTIKREIPYEFFQLVACGVHVIVGYCEQSQEIMCNVPTSVCSLYRNNDNESLKNQMIKVLSTKIHPSSEDITKVEEVYPIDNFNKSFAGIIHDYAC